MSAPATTSMALPPGSRPRNGQRPTGTAVPRTTVGSPSAGSSYVTAFPDGRSFPVSRYHSYGVYGFSSDPLLVDSYAYGGYYGYSPSAADAAAPTGSLRLVIDPRQAEVLVDGVFAGIVNEFDGMFHHLALPAGPHHITIHAEGYAPLEFDVMIEPRHTTTIKDTLH